jgi:adenosine deaminase
MRDPSTLPKAELHVHLEGSMRIGTIRDLADRQGKALPTGIVGSRDDSSWRFEDFMDFIAQYTAACSLMNDLDDFKRLGYEFCQDLATAGVRYAEAVFSPANHAGRLGDWDGPIEAVADGLAAGRRDFGPLVRLTPDIVRDFGIEEAEHTLQVALRHMDDGVIALNCAGSEMTGIEPFADLFRRAKAAGLRSVPHAGEWAGPQNVWETLEHYAPDRIGHGVRAIEDPRLVEHLAELGIPLEVSPVSNIATGVFASLDEHPFELLRRAGVVVTLNSDDPAMFGAWLDDVFQTARETWTYDDEQLAEIARTGVVASFADDELKASLLREIDGWLADDPELRSFRQPVT